MYSPEKKRNIKSSTKSDLVSMDNVLTQVIWARYFLKEQGYDIHDKFIYQDKQSSTKLEKMVDYQVESRQEISTSDITLSIIGSLISSYI